MAAITLAPNADKRKAAGPLNPDSRRRERIAGQRGGTIGNERKERKKTIYN